MPPSPLNLLTPCSQALKFMVVQTAPPQLVNLAASSQYPPPPLFNVGTVSHSIPLKLPPLLSEQHDLITPPYGTFALFFLPLSTKVQGPFLFTASALFLRDLIVLVFNDHLYVDNSQIYNIASDAFPSFVLYFRLLDTSPAEPKTSSRPKS